MANFESTDSKPLPKQESISSEVVAFFEDAYENHKVAGAAVAGTAMALGIFALTRGRSGSAALAAEGTLARTGITSEVAGAKIGTEIGAKLGTDAMRYPGTMQNMLLHGAVVAERPNAVRLIELGIPRNMDLATSRKLATGLADGNKGAVTGVMDDIFSGTSYQAMTRRFGP